MKLDRDKRADSRGLRGCRASARLPTQIPLLHLLRQRLAFLCDVTLLARSAARSGGAHATGPRSWQVTQAPPVRTCHPSWMQRWVQGGAWDLSRPRQPVPGHSHDPLGERSPPAGLPSRRERAPAVSHTWRGKRPGCDSDAETWILIPSCGLRTQPGLKQASESREPMHSP